VVEHHPPVSETMLRQWLPLMRHVPERYRAAREQLLQISFLPMLPFSISSVNGIRIN
jgi:hypothetical protein